MSGYIDENHLSAMTGRQNSVREGKGDFYNCKTASEKKGQLRDRDNVKSE